MGTPWYWQVIWPGRSTWSGARTQNSASALSLALVCAIFSWSAYGRLSPFCRQVCWAPLKRDSQKLVGRGGPAARRGHQLQRVAERVFAGWHLFRGGGIDRPALQRRLDGPAKELKRFLRPGRRGADPQAAAFRANVLALLPAVWRFVVTDGAEPTNNHAERLRAAGCCGGRTPSAARGRPVAASSGAC
jgi:hypothetical protein